MNATYTLDSSELAPREQVVAPKASTLTGYTVKLPYPGQQLSLLADDIKVSDSLESIERRARAALAASSATNIRFGYIRLPDALPEPSLETYITGVVEGGARPKFATRTAAAYRAAAFHWCRPARQRHGKWIPAEEPQTWPTAQEAAHAVRKALEVGQHLGLAMAGHLAWAVIEPAENYDAGATVADELTKAENSAELAASLAEVERAKARLRAIEAKLGSNATPLAPGTADGTSTSLEAPAGPGQNWTTAPDSPVPGLRWRRNADGTVLYQRRTGGTVSPSFTTLDAALAWSPDLGTPAPAPEQPEYKSRESTPDAVKQRVEDLG